MRSFSQTSVDAIMKNRLFVSVVAIVLGTKLATAQAPAQVGSVSPYPQASVAGTTTGFGTATRVPPSVAANDMAVVPSLPSGGVEYDPSSNALWVNNGAACGPPGRAWVSADYLLWWIKGSYNPPLLTTSPAGTSGILGPNTTILYGGGNNNYGPFSGGRFTFGYWLDEQQTIGLEGNGLFLGTLANDYSAGGNGTADSPTIARPFANAVTGRQGSELVAAPNLLSGTANVHSDSWLAGGEFNGLLNLYCACAFRLDMLGGFRYFQLNDNLGINENLSVSPNVPIFGGSSYGIMDQFSTTNRFYGGQLGLRGRVDSGRFFAVFTGEVGLGAVNEVVAINGSTLITPAVGTPTTGNGGLLALPTNMGYHTQTRFAVMPEVGLDLGYRLTNSIYASVGYSFLYLSNAVRPGDQIDNVVNPTQLPSLGAAAHLIGPSRPGFAFHETDFWAQGLRFALDFRF
jgi:hypothetical protein